jgi:hypothetical protein
MELKGTSWENVYRVHLAQAGVVDACENVYEMSSLKKKEITWLAEPLLASGESL